jgi:hypothetical protein
MCWTWAQEQDFSPCWLLGEACCWQQGTLLQAGLIDVIADWIGV